MEVFKSQSFTRYVISVLNPDMRTSALMNDIDKPVEGIVFKFITPGESEVYSARLIDPIFHQHNMAITKPVDRKANDMYQIAMLFQLMDQQRRYKLLFLKIHTMKDLQVVSIDIFSMLKD